MNYLSKIPYIPPSYETMRDANALMEGTTEASYNASVGNLNALKGMTVSSITYESEGLAITGLEILPKLAPGEKIPLMIYCRGGNGNYGMLSPGQVTVLMAPFVQRMKLAVLASNYRGNGGSEGAEEFGGADVNDVLNLIALGMQQPWWDGRNLFLLGWSRGGMMTYLTLKAGIMPNAAVVGAGVTDLVSASAHRPLMEERVYKRRIPDYDARREELLQARSAVCWPEKLNAPLLILHGDADDKVEVNQARILVEKLQALGKMVRYVEYPEGNHALRKHWKQWTDEAVAWFELYRK